MQHIGIDVHTNSCQVCILTEDGELIKTDRTSLHTLFSDRPRARILIESSTENEWVARCLEELGHDVIVADPNFAQMYATTYTATLDGVARFQDARQVSSYPGLVPRQHSSGEKQHRGRISKAGNGRTRALLVEAAWARLRWKTPKTQGLHEGAARIALRRGKATAVVALARKLAGIMFAIWRDGTEFSPEHVTGHPVTAGT